MEKVRQQFWQRIYGNKELAKLNIVPLVENNFSNFIELLNDRIEEFPDQEDGYYYPVKIGDTYALQINYSGKLNDPDSENPNIAEQVQFFKLTILTKIQNIKPNLGQSWLISAQMTDAEEAESVAQECYQSWNERANWLQDCKGRGMFKGAAFFEFEQHDTTPDGINENEHVLICLFPPTYNKDEMNHTIAQLYRDLIRLFLYRNKVLWIYEQSRQVKTILKQMSRAVQQMDSNLYSQINNASVDLHQLQKVLADALSVSNKYESFLGNLQGQLTTIDINTQNYERRVKNLRSRDTQAKLEFLDCFSTYVTEVCIVQIKTESAAFDAGLKPIETFIKTVQGITEIEKAKNDRTFNQTVAIATVGVSTASLATSTLSNQADAIVRAMFPIQPNQPTPPLNAWLNAGLPFGLSIVIGALFAVVTWALLNRGVKHHR
ncbi:MAG: hypothetical protein Kow00121_20640 [Elainellaceae cyanobacterium]